MNNMGLPDSPRSPKGGLPPDKPISYANAATSSREIELLLSCSRNGSRPWFRAINKNALLFDLTQLQISETTFLTVARKHYPSKRTCGMIFRKENRRLIAEVVFNSEKIQKKYSDVPLHFPNNLSVLGNLPIPDEWEVVKLHLRNMPILPQPTLQEAITAATSNYGHILELGIYKDHGWFTGSGYMYINRATSNAPLTSSATQSPPLPLNHTIDVKLKYSDDRTWVHKMYATWSRMPLFCRYCHLPGHNKLTCISKPQPRCHHCQSLGHLRKQCPVKHAVQETNPSKDSPDMNNRSVKRYRTTSPMSASPTITPNTQDDTPISTDDFPTLSSSTRPHDKADLQPNEHSESTPSNDSPSPETELQDVVMTSQQEADSRPPDP